MHGVVAALLLYIRLSIFIAGHSPPISFISRIALVIKGFRRAPLGPVSARRTVRAGGHLSDIVYAFAIPVNRHSADF
jgi:hypothetical protein